MVSKIGQNIVGQKHRFVGLENGPVSCENVGHIVDLCYVPDNESRLLLQNQYFLNETSLVQYIE